MGRVAVRGPFDPGRGQIGWWTGERFIRATPGRSYQLWCALSTNRRAELRAMHEVAIVAMASA